MPEATNRRAVSFAHIIYDVTRGKVKTPKRVSLVVLFRDRNWEVQAGSPDKIFDKKCLYV